MNQVGPVGTDDLADLCETGTVILDEQSDDLLSGVGSKVTALLEQLPKQSLDLRANVTVRHSHASHGQGYRRGVVHGLQGLSGAEIHVHPARQAGVEAAHRAHDVDALEVVR